jgi:MFS family permease
MTTTPEAAAPEADGGLRALWRDSGFRRFWLSRLAGTGAAQMLLVALGWQMYDLTGSAWDLGLVGLVQFVPALALALPAGHVVDRHERRRVLAAVLALQTGVAALLALASARGAGRGDPPGGQPAGSAAARAQTAPAPPDPAARRCRSGRTSASPAPPSASGWRPCRPGARAAA